MKYVQFPIKKDGQKIIYPDDIKLFRDTRRVGDNIEGWYSGTMKLTEVKPPAPESEISKDELAKSLADTVDLEELETTNTGKALKAIMLKLDLV